MGELRLSQFFPSQFPELDLIGLVLPGHKFLSKSSLLCNKILDFV